MVYKKITAECFRHSAVIFLVLLDYVKLFPDFYKGLDGTV